MANKWYYCVTKYTTEALANAAVLVMKERLDNNPTDWVIVKELAGNASEGWVVPVAALTDNEISNLDSTKYYSVASIIDADNDTGLTAAEVTAKVSEHRTAYANHMMVNSIFKLQDDSTEVQEYAPTNVDMSEYV